MGDEADDVLHSFGMTDANSKKYQKDEEQFETYFVKYKNVIFKSARFNQRQQKEGESVEALTTSHHKLVEHCNFWTMLDEMVRD